MNQEWKLKAQVLTLSQNQDWKLKAQVLPVIDIKFNYNASFMYILVVTLIKCSKFNLYLTFVNILKQF